MLNIILIGLLVLFLLMPYRENFEQLFWNTTRHTRNMLYDIRCNPFTQQKQEFLWLNSELEPDRLQRCLK